MAQLANSFATFSAVGLRESLADKIYMISPEETPFVSAIGKGKAESVYEEWQTDALAAATNNKVEQGNEGTPAAVTATGRMGNRTQISEKVYAVTGTQEAVSKAGRKSEVAYQDAKKMVELKRDIDFACLQNTTAIAAAAGTAGQARGVLGFLATNTAKGASGVDPNPTSNIAPTDGTLATLTEAMFQSVAQKCWESGGNPTMAFVPSALRSKVSAWTGAATKFDKTEDKTIYATVEVYVGDFGRYSIINSRNQRAREIFLIQPDMWELMTLRPMKGQDLAKTGDSQKRLINTEWTLKCGNEAANGAVRDVQAA
ncbi:MAG: phage head protein [Burkholderiaceae bacterium]|nr:phage head protein [Burkholderiaceae bacterium]